jgi:hypothetical protein
VEYWATVPREFRAAIDPVLATVLAGPVPSWLRRLTVKVVLSTEGDESEEAGIESLPEYREACLTVTPVWLEGSPARRLTVLRHEIVHAYFAEMDVVMARALAAVKVRNPGLASELEESWRRANEGAVCDVTAAIEALSTS